MGKRKTTQVGQAADQRFHPSQASDELVFAVCQRFLAQTGKSRKGVASAVVQWLRETYGRTVRSQPRHVG